MANLELLVRRSSPNRLARTTPQPRPRVRPGESARYVTLSLTGPAETTLRDEATRLEMSVDAVVATVLELLSARDLLGSLGAVVDRAPLSPRSRDRPEAIPPTAALQEWVGWLEEARLTTPSARHDDELPEVLLPERLEPRLRHIGIDAVVQAIGSDDAALAKRCDVQAAREGLTLTEWMLVSALAASRPGGGAG